jgi:hypothetical protein
MVKFVARSGHFWAISRRFAPLVANTNRGRFANLVKFVARTARPGLAVSCGLLRFILLAKLHRKEASPDASRAPRGSPPRAGFYEW